MYIVQKFCRKVELMCVLMSSRAINYTGGAIKSITGAYDAKYSILDYRPQYVFGLMIKDGKYVTVAKKHRKW